MNTGPRPPRLLEWLLDHVVKGDLGGRAAVGDLAEAYHRRRGHRSRWRSDIWYWGQALSLLGHVLVRDIKRGVTGLGTEATSAVRVLARRPLSTAGVVVTLAVGLGANAAVLRVVEGTLRATDWWSDQESTWALWPDRPFSRGELWMFEQEAPEGILVGGYRLAAVSVETGEADVASRNAAILTPALFANLRVQPVLGRGLTAADSEPGAEPVVVLHEGYWRRAFGGDASILGRRIEVNGVAHTVVGIQGAGGSAPGVGTELWLPVVMDPSDPEFFPAFDLHGIVVAAGMDAGDVRTELRRFAAGMADRFPFFYPPDFGRDAAVESASARVRAPLRTPLALLLAGTLILLLVTAVNVGNLLLARSIERGPELAVRRALGADRLRIARQLALEAGVLTAVAATAGVLFATPASSLLARLFPGDVPVAAGSWSSWPVVGAVLLTLAVVWSLLTAVPVVHFLGRDRRGVRENVRSGGLAPRGLVALQSTAATALLVTAMLLVGSVQALRESPLGFQPAGVTVAPTALPATFLSDRGRLRGVQEALPERARGLSGVESAGLTSHLPLLDPPQRYPVNPRSRPVDVSVAVRAGRIAIGPGYMEAMGIRLLEGRRLGTEERGDAPTAVLVNETLARTLWPEGDAVGRRVAIDPHAWDEWVQVVGVVADARTDALVGPSTPAFYVSLYEQAVRKTTLVVRGGGSAAALAPALRALATEVDPTIPVGAVRPMAEVVQEAYGEARVTMALLAGLALVATALAALGVHAVLAQVVAAGRRELGVRLALGSGRGRVIARVVRSGLAPVVVGAVLGCVAAASGAELLGDLLYGVAALEPRALGLGFALVMAAGTAASIVPALRAGFMTPAEVMRTD